MDPSTNCCSCNCRQRCAYANSMLLLLVPFQLRLPSECLGTHTALVHITGMGAFMTPQMVACCEALVAVLTLVGLFSSVGAHMPLETAGCAKRLLALTTNVRPRIAVNALMGAKRTTDVECFATILACIRPLAIVHAHVGLQIVALGACLAADLAGVWLVAGMCALVQFEQAGKPKDLFANVALVLGHDWL